MKKLLKNKKGFTLIELVVVIAILGILAAIAIPRLGGFTDKAKIATINANHDTVVTAINTVYTENNSWPADLTDVAKLLSGDFTLTSNSVLTDTAGGVHTWNSTAHTLTTTSSVSGFTTITYDGDIG